MTKPSRVCVEPECHFFPCSTILRLRPVRTIRVTYSADSRNWSHCFRVTAQRAWTAYSPTRPKLPLRKDLKSVLLIGSGPIVIGQACEFDYSGTQALKALREEGLRLILINSNPATIMTDPELADRTYIEPMTPETIAKIIERERP